MVQKISSFFAESRQEFRRINWPDRQETVRLTLWVVGFSLGVAAFLGAFDILFSYLLSLIIGAK